MSFLETKIETEAHIRNVKNHSNFITDINGYHDPDRKGRLYYVEELVNTLDSLNRRISELEAEIIELKK